MSDTTATHTGAGLNLMLVAIAALLLLAVPFWMPGIYYINVASQVLHFAIFALALNVLVGYAGLTSLGHAALFAWSGYALAVATNAGFSPVSAVAVALTATLVVSAIFALLALRASGIGFLMITLALGQIVWGIAYRWVDVTGGDNGLSIKGRPRPFGIDLASPSTFYWMSLLVFAAAVITMLIFVRSPLGAALRGTRDQPRRMSALGFDVWAIRFAAFMLSGFWTGVAGLLFLYYNQFVSPQVAALQSSAEALLMVISGGSGTVLGPIVGATLVVLMKNIVSAYIERWNLVLGVIFVCIVSFMPQGLVPGIAGLWRKIRARGAA